MAAKQTRSREFDFGNRFGQIIARVDGRLQTWRGLTWHMLRAFMPRGLTPVVVAGARIPSQAIHGQAYTGLKWIAGNAPSELEPMCSSSMWSPRQLGPVTLR